MTTAHRRGRSATVGVPRCPRAAPGRSRGFGYIWVLIAVALLGALLAGAGKVWETAARREREKQLLFAGDQIRAAIGAWYESSPGGANRFPPTLEHLLRDPRYPTTRRHLRKVYADPMTEDGQWGLVTAPDGGIAGVYSKSERAPLKTGGFAQADQAFEGAARYADWKFLYTGGASGSEEAGTASSARSSGGSAPTATAAAAPATVAPTPGATVGVPVQPVLIPTTPAPGASPPGTTTPDAAKSEPPKSTPDCESQRLAFVQRCVAAAKGKAAIERACEATSFSQLQLCVRYSGG